MKNLKRILSALLVSVLLVCEGGGSNSTTFIGPYPADFKGPLLRMWDGVVNVHLSSNGTSWDIAYRANTGLIPVVGTTYWFKLGFTGSLYYLDYNTDGSSNYTRQWTLSSSTKTQGSFIFLNNTYNLSTEFSPGNIDLSECSIVQNGTTIWQGVVSDTNGIFSFTQPIFYSNTTWGTVSASSFYETQPPWKALNGVVGIRTNDWALANSGKTGYWQWLFAKKLKINAIQIYNRGGADTYGGATTYTIYGINDNNSETQIGTVSVDAIDYDSRTISILNDSYFKGIKVNVSGSLAYAGIGQVNLTAVQKSDYYSDILVSDDTRTYSGEYTSRTLVNKVKTTSSDYDASEIVKRQSFLKANNNFYLFKTPDKTYNFITTDNGGSNFIVESDKNFITRGI